MYALNKKELLDLPAEEKVELMGELWGSLDPVKTIPDWKRNLIRERIELDKLNPGNGLSRVELKKKYV